MQQMLRQAPVSRGPAGWLAAPLILLLLELLGALADCLAQLATHIENGTWPLHPETPRQATKTPEPRRAIPQPGSTRHKPATVGRRARRLTPRRAPAGTRHR